MAKSNMRSAGIRKHHRRIEHQARIDSRANRERAFKQKEQPHIMTVLHLSFIAAALGKLKGFFNRYFNPFHFSTPRFNLNLRSDMTMGEDQHRAAGANMLRSWFPGLGKMVSTRDGRKV